MTEKIKLEHFRNLVSLAGADGKIREEELNTLSKIAREQQIPEDRLNFMIKKAGEYAYIVPQNRHAREKQLHDMLELALVDGEFSSPEKELIYNVGERLGFTKEEIDNLVDQHTHS